MDDPINGIYTELLNHLLRVIDEADFHIHTPSMSLALLQ